MHWRITFVLSAVASGALSAIAMITDDTLLCVVCLSFAVGLVRVAWWAWGQAHGEE